MNSVLDETGICKICGSQFVKYRPYQKYCSDDCRYEATSQEYTYKIKPSRMVVCPICKREFITNNKKKRFCSILCQERDKKMHYKPMPETARVCPVCNKTFYSSHGGKKYCSNECYIKARSQRESRYVPVPKH